MKTNKIDEDANKARTNPAWKGLEERRSGACTRGETSPFVAHLSPFSHYRLLGEPRWAIPVPMIFDRAKRQLI